MSVKSHLHLCYTVKSCIDSPMETSKHKGSKFGRLKLESVDSWSSCSVVYSKMSNTGMKPLCISVLCVCMSQ